MFKYNLLLNLIYCLQGNTNRDRFTLAQLPLTYEKGLAKLH